MKIMLSGKNQVIDVPDGSTTERIETIAQSHYTPDELKAASPEEPTTFQERQVYRASKGRAMLPMGRAFTNAAREADPKKKEEMYKYANDLKLKYGEDYNEVNDKKYQSHNWAESIVGGTTELAPYMMDSSVQAIRYGEMFGAGFAGIAWAAGSTLFAPFPEEVITVPAAWAGGRQVGQAYGAWKNASEVEGGMLTSALLDMGVDRDLAESIGPVGGAVIGAVEMFQIGHIFNKLIPGAKVLSRKGITAAIGRLAKAKGGREIIKTLGRRAATFSTQMALHTGLELGEEVTQEYVGIASEALGAIIHNERGGDQVDGPGLLDITERVNQTIIQGLWGFPLMGLPGSVMTTFQTHGREAVLDRYLTKRATDSMGLELSDRIVNATKFKTLQEFQDSDEMKGVDDAFAQKYGFDNRQLYMEGIWKASRDVVNEDKIIDDIILEKRSREVAQTYKDELNLVIDDLSTPKAKAVIEKMLADPELVPAVKTTLREALDKGEGSLVINSINEYLEKTEPAETVVYNMKDSKLEGDVNLPPAIKKIKDLARKLGVNIGDVVVIDKERVLDPFNPSDMAKLKQGGFTIEEVKNAIAKGQRFRIAGEHTVHTSASGRKGSSITLYRGHGEADIYHEFAHAVEEQGGLPGWVGTKEEHAAYLENLLNEGREGELVEFTMEGSRVEGAAILTDGTEAVDLNSVRTVEQTKQETLERNKKSKQFSTAQINKYFKDLNNVTAFILANKKLLDFAPAEYLAALKSNSDPQYKKSVDFTTMCVKRYVMQSTIDAIQLKLGRPLLASEFMDIRRMLMEKGQETSCGACYVDSRRINMGTVLNKAIAKYVYGLNIKDKDAARLIEDIAQAREAGVQPLTDIKYFLTSTGIERLAVENPEMYKGVRKLFGGTQMKIPEARTEYRGDILKLTAATVDSMNQFSGLRWQSWSDFELPHLLDAMQAIGDMSIKGLKGQAYTKQVNFARIFAPTGMMINMSLIPKGMGFDSKGNLAWDETQSFPVKEAMKLRKKYPNLGTIAIGVSDKHIRALLKDPTIDYVIPYHKSGLSELNMAKLGMEGWTDYTDVQSFTTQEGGETNDKIFIAEWKADRKRLAELEKERGILSPFQAMTHLQGYEKLLTDRRIYGLDGRYQEQDPVSTNFDMVEVQNALNTYVKEGGTKVKADADVVKQFSIKVSKEGVADYNVIGRVNLLVDESNKILKKMDSLEREKRKMGKKGLDTSKIDKEILWYADQYDVLDSQIAEILQLTDEVTAEQKIQLKARDLFVLERKILRQAAKSARLVRKDAVKKAKGERDALAKEKAAKIQELKNWLNEYVIESLPKAERGAFTTAIAKVKTVGQLAKQLTRVEKLAEKAQKKGWLKQIQNQMKQLERSKSVSIDYIQQIHDFLSEYELKGHSKALIKRLEGTRDYLNSERQAGRTVEMPLYVLESLEILSRKPLEDLKAVDLKDISLKIKAMTDLGKTKFRSRKAADKIMKAHDLAALQKDSKPVKAKAVKKEYKGITDKLGVIDRVLNSIKTVVNWSQMRDLVITPMDAIFDHLDGQKDYMGANFRIFKRRADLAYSMYLQEKDDINKKIDKLANDLKLKEANMNRIGLYAAKVQKGGMEKLLTFFTQQEIDKVVLNEAEMKLYNFMRDELDSLRPRIETIMREVYNKPLGAVENYFPFMTDFDAMSDSEILERFGDGVITLDEGEALKKNVEMGFTIARKGGAVKIKINAAEVFGKHLDNALYLIHMGRETKYMGELASTEEYAAAVGDVGQEVVREWVDLLARKGVAKGDRIKLLDTARNYTGLVALGLKLSSTLVQITALMDGASLIGGHAFTGFGNIVRSADWREFIYNNMPEVRDRVGDDVALSEFSKSDFDINAIAYAPLKTVDKFAACGVAAGAYMKYLEDNGLSLDLNNPNPDAIAYAQKMMRRTQSSSQFKDMPLAISKGLLLQKKGNVSVAKSLLQFQSFMLNRWSLIRHDLWRAGIKGKNKKQAVAIAAWLIAANFAELNIRKLSKEMVAALMGRDIDEDDDDDREFLQNVGQVLQNIPFMGSLYYSILYGDLPVPTISMVGKLVKKLGIAAKTQTSEEKEDEEKQLAWTRFFISLLPGGQQIERNLREE